MRTALARVHIGGYQFRTQEITILSREEAKAVLQDKDWEIGEYAYDVNNPNSRIAVSATWKVTDENGVTYTDGIYYE